MRAPGPGTGRVVAARGSVVDVEFAGDLPAIREALAIDWDAGQPLIAEAQQHLDPRRVCAVALLGTGGLKRGTSVRCLEAPVRVPVGQPVLGRSLNVLGDTTDRGPALPLDVTRRPIHGLAAALARQSAARERYRRRVSTSSVSIRRDRTRSIAP